MMQAAFEDSQEIQPTPSRWEDFVDILYAPGVVFERRRGARFGWTLVALTALLALLLVGNMAALSPIYEAEMLRSLQAAGGEGAMAPAQMMTFGIIAGVIGFVVAFPIMVLFLAAVLWGATRLFGTAIAFGSAGLIATYAQIPVIFAQLAAIIQGLLLDVRGMDSLRDVSLSAARFLPESTSPLVVALAGRIELFGLWGLVLMAIGVGVIARLPRAQAAAIAGIAWVVGALPEITGALLQGG